MAVVCPSCDVIPPPEAAAGTRCAGCGARLVAVTARVPDIGTIVDGRFEIRERLGSGAMGVVYRATQLSIGRDVALKILPSIHNEAVIKRFFREARIASALNHPNTVQIIEFGQGADGHVYLAMELVAGHTLHDEIAKGALPLARIIRIGTQLCDAIASAHRLTIVHRDLKLENVMIATDGSDHIKVLDFGIARVLGDASSQVTATGMAAGTPHYMAPEVLARAVDPAPPQDMYAVGVILAELSLGEPLWTSAKTLPMLLIEKTRNTVVDRVPARLRPLVRRLLAEDPDARPTPADTRKQLLAMEGGDALAATAEIAPVSNLEHLSLDVVSLDERDGDKRAPPPASAFEPPKVDTPALDIVEPGASLDLDPSHKRAPVDTGPALKLDGAWERDRARRGATTKSSHEAQRFAKEHAPRARTGGGGRWLVVLLIVAAVGGAAAYYYVTTKRRAASESPPVTTPQHHSPTHRPHTAPRDTPTTPRDTPTPTADAPAPPADDSHGVTIRIIGVAGTPIKIDGASAGKLPIKLSRKKGTKPILIEAPGVVRQVVPDHSQTVNLSSSD